MVLFNQSVRTPYYGAKGELMSKEDFKKWLMQFDHDKDGQITEKELRDAIKYCGGWFFCGRKARQGVKLVDVNFNGVIDVTEIDNLVEFARMHMGLQIISTN